MIKLRLATAALGRHLWEFDAIGFKAGCISITDEKLAPKTLRRAAAKDGSSWRRTYFGKKSSSPSTHVSSTDACTCLLTLFLFPVKLAQGHILKKG
jgi:hypothetical protein